MSDCYVNAALARARANEMEKNKDCDCYTNMNGQISRPRIFSVHIYNDLGKDGTKPDVEIVNDQKTGKPRQAKMDNWDYKARDGVNPKTGQGWVNYDFGYLKDGREGLELEHATQADVPKGSMKTKISKPEAWKAQIGPNTDFNIEIWCVTCERDDLKKQFK